MATIPQVPLEKDQWHRLRSFLEAVKLYVEGPFRPRVVTKPMPLTSPGELVIWQDPDSGNDYLVYDKAGTQIKVQLS